ncbi:MAG TPA: hypothetical protein VGN88_07465 [Phycisphaerae bacterium]|jgi:hypothetical protein
MATLTLDCDSMAALLRVRLKGAECSRDQDGLKLLLPLLGPGMWPIRVMKKSQIHDDLSTVPINFEVTGFRRPLQMLSPWFRRTIHHAAPFLELHNSKTLMLDLAKLVQSNLGVNLSKQSIAIQDFIVPGPDGSACQLNFRVERKINV